MSSILAIRMPDARKSAIMEEATRRGESISDFVQKAVMFYITDGKNASIEPMDPFVMALRHNEPVAMTPTQQAAAARADEALHAGTFGHNTAADALTLIRHAKNHPKRVSKA